MIYNESQVVVFKYTESDGTESVKRAVLCGFTRERSFSLKPGLMCVVGYDTEHKTERQFILKNCDFTLDN
jgi:hypothetical protein